MATIRRFPFVRHLRAEPNQFMLHYRNGRLARKGPGLSYWFTPLSAAIAQVPIEDNETTLVLRERTKDLQEVAVQLTVVYRFADPEKAAVRSNFTIGLDDGQWVEKPLDRIDAFWSQRVREPVRLALASITLEDAVRAGIGAVRAAVVDSLKGDTEVPAMGVMVVGVAVIGVAPAPELVKAMETPTREAIQQRADQAVFERRAMAVEKERAIKENELSTQIELARRQDELIQRQNSNKVREIEGKAQAERMRVQSEQEIAKMAAEGYARDIRTRGEGDADARRAMMTVEAASESAKAHAYDGVRTEVIWALAAKQLATKLDKIDHVTLTPDTFGPMLSKIIRGEKDA